MFHGFPRSSPRKRGSRAKSYSFMMAALNSHGRGKERTVSRTL